MTARKRTARKRTAKQATSTPPSESAPQPSGPVIANNSVHQSVVVQNESRHAAIAALAGAAAANAKAIEETAKALGTSTVTMGPAISLSDVSGAMISGCIVHQDGPRV